MRTVRKFLVLAVLATLCASQAADGEEPKTGKTKHKGHFTIGKETTVITGPVDKEGYISYAAALNKQMSAGVKPQDNMVVLLWQAYGPRSYSDKGMPPEMYKWLGSEPLPAKGDYFVSMDQYFRTHLKLTYEQRKKEWDEWDLAYARPWKANEHKNLAVWLKANEKPLDLAVTAIRRPHYFAPMVPPDGMVGYLPGIQMCREIANDLRIRATLRLGEGDHDGAWQDLLACNRLGRMVSHGNTLSEYLVGNAIEAIVADAFLIYLDHVKPDAKKLAGCLRDLRNLPPMRELAEVVDQGERFLFLDWIMDIDRNGMAYLDTFGWRDNERKSAKLADHFLANIDWDPAMRNGNIWFNRVTTALRIKERAVRKAEMLKIEEEVKALNARVQTVKGLAHVFGGAAEFARAVPVKSWPVNTLVEVLQRQTGAARGKLMGDVLVSMLMRSMRKLENASDRRKQLRDNLEVAFALALYQSDQGRYPEKLDALTPKYLDTVPQDVFSGQPLVYRRTEKGYLLYSVGPNGKDEGGRWYDDDPPGDDIRIRMPRELSKMK